MDRELTENERKAIEGIYTLTNALWSKQDQKANRLQVMSWLEGLVEDDWREYHSDSEVSNIAEAALELLKKQVPIEPISDSKLMYGYCPSCKRILTESRYCGHCGQAIKHTSKFGEKFDDVE